MSPDRERQGGELLWLPVQHYSLVLDSSKASATGKNSQLASARCVSSCFIAFSG